MEYRLKTTFQNELYFIFTSAYNVSNKTTIKLIFTGLILMKYRF